MDNNSGKLVVPFSETLEVNDETWWTWWTRRKKHGCSQSWAEYGQNDGSTAVHAWDVAGHSEHLEPDPDRDPVYTQFILDGRLNVDEANSRWMQEFMARNGLTAEDLEQGG